MAGPNALDGGAACGAAGGDGRCAALPAWHHKARGTPPQSHVSTLLAGSSLSANQSPDFTDLQREVALLQGTPEVVNTPSASGAGQRISRCPSCRVALWSNYGANTADLIRFVRVGTLAEPGAITPDVHIFTSSKLPWVVLPEGQRSFEAFYDRKQEWPQESLDRRRAVLDAARRT